MEQQQAQKSQPQSSDDAHASGTTPSSVTANAERAEAGVHSGADRAPTEDEERVAESRPGVTDEQRAHAEEMADLGVRQRGEGRIP